jgi:hypothetical protein
MGQRIAHERPHLREGRLDLAHGGAPHLDAGVTPRRDTPRGIADPRLSHAETADEAHPAVDREDLPVVTAQPSERARQARRVVTAHLDTARPQTVPELSRGLAEAAQPVVDDADADPVGRPRDQRVAELLAARVVMNDVALEVDGPGGAGDCVEPRRVVLAGVLQELDVVAGQERRAGGARERLLGEGADGLGERGRGRHRDPEPRMPQRGSAASAAFHQMRVVAFIESASLPGVSLRNIRHAGRARVEIAPARSSIQ